MPKFAVFRKVTSRVVVEADDDQHALEIAEDEGEIFGDDQEIHTEWKVVPEPPK